MLLASNIRITKGLTKGSGSKEKEGFEYSEKASHPVHQIGSEAGKKQKIPAKLKDSAPKKRKSSKMAPAETKVEDVLEKTIDTSPSSCVGISEILKVTTEPFPFSMLSPLGSDLTSLLQSKENVIEQSSRGKEIASATGGNFGGQKKRRMMNVMKAIQKTPPPALAEEIVVPANAKGNTDVEADESAPEVENLGTTMSEIDRIIADVTPEKDIAEVSTDKASALKMKELKKVSSEDTELDLRHLGGQELSYEDISELKDFAIAGGYKSGSVLFGGIDEEILGCIPDRAGAKIVNTLSKSIRFLKLERDLSNYRRQHITGSLFYSNFKVYTFMSAFLNF
jgi:hypothetical protein